MSNRQRIGKTVISVVFLVMLLGIDFTVHASESAYSCYERGKELEERGDYTLACDSFEKSLEYAYNERNTVIIKHSEERVRQYKSVFDLYTLVNGQQLRYGAKNEPMGFLYGENFEQSKSNESMIAGYLDYKGMSISYLDKYLKSAESSGKALMLALNFRNEAEMKSACSDYSFLNNISSRLNSQKNVPVYIRIGAEMNIWSNLPNPDGYKICFRDIANYFRSKSPHAAVMWSIAQNSAWNVDYNDYYPGDGYVDWIGISAYAKKYFNGQRTISAGDAAYFNVGDYADPELAIADIVEDYGNRKPIMISEGGAAYQTDGSVNEQYGAWGAVHLRKLLSYVPMLYPQVRGFNYFNNEVAGEINHFALSKCSALQNTFDNLTSKEWFAHKSFNGASKSFVRLNDSINISDGRLEVCAYNHVFGDKEPSVDYYIDGALKLSAKEIPYFFSCDVSGMTNGAHSLKAVLNLSNGETMTREYALNVSGNTARFENFKDISSLNQVQLNSLRKMFDKGIIKGYDDASMKPYGSVTRAEFAAMLCRACGYNSNSGCTFSDAAGHWASGYIQACVNKGAINGIGSNLFAPDDKVRFEQAVKILTVSSGMTEGYDISGMGGYPSAYIKVGRNYGLFNNVEDPVTGDELSRIDAVVLISNSMSADAGRTPVIKNTPAPTAKPTPTPAPKTLYRYRDKETKQSSQSSLSGWTRVDSKTTYGNWSEYSDNYIAVNDTTEVRTRTVKTETKHYKTQYWYGGYFWTIDGRYQSSARPKSGVDNVFRDTGWIDYELEFAQDFGNGYIMYRNPYDGLYYFRNPHDQNYQPSTREVYSHSTFEEKTQYSSRNKQTTYYYERWGEWSSWSESPATSNGTRQVEKTTKNY